jgi:hypothetical protein
MNDLETRFDELVGCEPGGDADAVLAGATRALARRDRRRRAGLAGGVGAVVVAAVLVAVQMGSNGHAAPMVDEETTTTTSVPTRTNAADDGEIAVSLTLPESLVAGERVWADLEVRNIGARPLWWQAGGDTPPVSAWLLGGTVDREWSGDPDELAASLATRVDPSFVDQDHTGLSTFGRRLDSRMKALAPGEVQRFRVSADIRIPPRVATLTANVNALFYDEADHYGGEGSVGPRPAVSAEVEIPVGPVPDDSSAALADFVRDPRLAKFVEEIRTTAYYTEMVWWRGAWELVVIPHYVPDHPKPESRHRMRWQDGEIIDARRIYWGQAPADDPEGTRYSGAPPDDVE